MSSTEKKPKMNSMDVIKFLLNKTTEITPSEFNREMQLTPEERFDRQIKSFRKSAGSDFSFSRNPEVVIFQNFELGKPYSTTLVLSNLHKVSRHLHVLFDKSPIFKISNSSEIVCSKVAPGMSYTINIHFFALEIKDYEHQIIFKSDSDVFTVSLIALAKRPIINFPDHISLPKTVSKLASEKTIVLQNTSNISASFTLNCALPFIVFPCRIILHANSLLDIKFQCISPKVGEFLKTLTITFDDEIRLSATLSCSVVNSNIYLDKSSVEFVDTCMGLKNVAYITLFNESNHPIRFNWKLHPNCVADEEADEKMIDAFGNLRDLEAKRSRKLQYLHVVNAQQHKLIYDRIYNDEMVNYSLQEQNFYKNPFFEVDPLSGDVYPKKTKTISLIFSPEKNFNYKSTAYLDVTGKDTRLELNLAGLGVGPKVELNIKELIVNNIYTRTKYFYEVVVTNCGNIAATISYKNKQYLFGGQIICKPERLTLKSDGLETVILEFVTYTEGKFIETVQFFIEESEDIVWLTLSGSAFCPLVEFMVEQIDFGVVPYGYSVKKTVAMCNKTQVPIKFNCEIENKNVLSRVDDGFSEFVVNFESDVIQAHSVMEIEILLTPKIIRDSYTNIVIKMWNSLKNVSFLPIRHKCEAPALIAIPDVINLGLCFLEQSYNVDIRLKNTSNLPGTVVHTPEKSEKVQYSLSFAERELKPFEEFDVEMDISLCALGAHEIPIIFTVLGLEPKAYTKILCNGQGPVLTFQPSEINFGSIELLIPASEKLYLSNESPVHAIISVEIDTNIFEIDETVIILNPNEKTYLTVSTCLKNCGKFRATIKLRVKQGAVLHIDVYAEGFGTSIFSKPTLKPLKDFGDLLTYHQFVFTVMFKNLGNWHHRLLLTRNPSLRSLKENPADAIPSYFSFAPNYFELSLDEQINLKLTGMSKRPQHVEEEFYLWATIEKSQLKKLMDIVLKARIVDPTLEFDKKELYFSRTTNVDEQSESMTDELVVKNVLNLVLKFEIRLSKNFCLKIEEQKLSEKVYELQQDEVLKIVVEFVPPPIEKRCFKSTGSLTIDYLHHPKNDFVTLTGEVFYPTIAICPSTIDFKCLPLKSFRNETIVVQNTSPIPVSFKWVIKEKDFVLETSEAKKPRVSHVVQYETEDLISMEEVVTEDRIKSILCPVVAKFWKPKLDQELLDKHENVQIINRVLTIEPSRCVLEPYESVVINVALRLPSNSKLTATVKCEVLGGEVEVLNIGAVSSRVEFSLNKECLEFGRPLFCETCQETILLTNSGKGNFRFVLHYDEANGSLIQPGRMQILRKSNFVKVGESVTLRVKYFPGVSGEFRKTFSIKVEYLKPVEISLHGFAVFSQIYLYLPIKEEESLDNNLTYKAIDTFTEDFFKSSTISELVREKPDPVEPDDEFIQELIEAGWEIIYGQFYPSELEISLALERIMVRNLVEEQPELLMNHTVKRRIFAIPDFKAPVYVVDLGFVPVNSEVFFKVLLLNYGPIKAAIKLEIEKKVFTDLQVQLFINEKKLYGVGEFGELLVIFKPTGAKYAEVHTNVEQRFSLKVKHGAEIPVCFKAIVTSSSIKADQNCIDFGTVKFGDCLRKSLILTNDGFIKSEFSIDIKSHQNNFFVVQEKTSLESGKSCMLHVYFEPKKGKFQTAQLVVDVKNTKEILEIKLCGFGIKPVLSFSQENLVFPSTLPYSVDNDMFVLVENCSTFPIEFFFSHYDKTIENEKAILKAFFASTGINKIYIPVRKVGDKLPEVFQKDKETLDDILIYLNPATAIYPLELTIEEPKLKLGSLYFFHGSPCTDHYKAAIEFGRTFSIPVISIDGLILEELANNNESLAANEVLGKIEKAFELIHKSQTNLAEETTKSYEEILDKVTKILEYNPSKNKKASPSPKKRGKSPDSAGDHKTTRHSKSSDKALKMSNADTFLDIPVDLFLDILKARFDREPLINLVVESLDSIFLRKPMIALNCLLKAIGNLKYINFILLSFLYKDFVSYENSKNAEKIINKAKDKEDMLERILQMDDEEFSTLSEAQNQIYKDYLSSRKVISKTRLSVLEEKKLSHPEKKKKKKEAAKLPKKAEEKSHSASAKSSAKSAKSKKKPKATKIVLSEKVKLLKASFEKFELFQDELLHVMEFWDRYNSILTKVYKISSPLSARASRQKPPNSKDSTTPRILVEGEEVGIPIFIMSNANNENGVDFSKLVCDLVKNIGVTEIQEELKVSLEEKFDTKEVLYTAIEKLINLRGEVSDVFSIANWKMPDKKSDSDIYAINYSKPTKRALSEIKLSRKRKTRDKKSFFNASVLTERKSETAIMEQVVEPEELIFTPRKIIFPGEVFHYRISFNPTTSGTYNYQFMVELVGTRINYKINCSALCELPKISLDPNDLFVKIIEENKRRSVYDAQLFIVDQNMFDFGTVIAKNPNDKRKSIAETSILLKNTTNLPCKINLHVDNDSQKEFTVQPEDLEVEANAEKIASIFLNTSRVAPIYSELFISVQDNPMVHRFSLFANAVKVDFEVIPRNVLFERTAVGCTEKRTVTLRNNNNVRFYWKLDNFEWLSKLMDISRVEGVIDAGSVFNVVFSFAPKSEEGKIKKNVEVKLYDYYTSAYLNYMTIVPFYIESMMINVEFEEDINLGKVKSGANHQQNYTMTNKGKYGVAVVFANLPDTDKDSSKKITRLFKITPPNAVLLPNKPHVFKVAFNSKLPLSFQSYPVFLCTFSDPASLDGAKDSYKTVFVTASAEIYVSSFEICPSEVNFGHLKVSTSKNLVILLKNTGKYKFDYSIVTLGHLTEILMKEKKKIKSVGTSESSRQSSGKPEKKTKRSKSSKSTEKSSKTPKSSSKKSTKPKAKKTKTAKKEHKVTTLAVGPFSITSSTGIVEPNATKEIQIDAKPSEMKRYEETIVFRVSQPKLEDLYGRSVVLSVSGCEPQLNFNLRNMFREQYFVDRFEDFIRYKNIGAFCLFEATGVKLSFNNVCINSTEETCIYIQNIGHATADVTLKFLNTKVFSVRPQTLTINPYATEIVTVQFKPDAIGDFKSTLEISYNSSVNNKFVVEVSGKAMVPEIILIEPQDKVLAFDPTCVGLANYKCFEFKNIGAISCKVIIEIVNDDKDLFCLEPLGELKVLLNSAELDLMEMRHTTLVNLLPEEVAKFKLEFKPKYEATFKIEINLHLVNNPFDLITIKVLAESYAHEIIMEHLKTLSLLKPSTLSLRKNQNFTGYQIDFGSSVPHKLLEKCFTIKNNSEINTYRFEFDKFGKFTFIPSIGHLKPQAAKDVIVTILPSESLHLIKETIYCNLCKIDYVNVEQFDLSWDDRQMLNLCEDFKLAIAEEQIDKDDTEMLLEKCIEGGEPEIVIQPETAEKIPIFLTICVANQKWKCNVEEINFADTFILTKASESFVVENTGMVPIDLQWVISEVEEINLLKDAISENKKFPSCASQISLSCLTDSDKNLVEEHHQKSSLPFSIDPQNILIPPKKKQEFIVNFEPIREEIAYNLLAKNIDPKLEINVKINAKSLVPQFYFDLAPSDYLQKRSSFHFCCEAFDIEDAGLQIVEFESVGVKTISKREFSLFNNTKNILSYRFENVRPDFSYFNCKTTQGVVSKDKKDELVFSFVPQELGSFEDYYFCYLQELDLKIPFLLAGVCREAKVYFQQACLKMKTIVLGNEETCVITLCNEDDVDLRFAVAKTSLFNEDQEDALKISPISGVLKAKSLQNFKLTFKPTKESAFSFNLKCKVDTKKYPLNVAVSANAVEIRCNCFYFNKAGVKIFLDAKKVNVIDFGVVTPRLKESVLITVANTCGVGIYYKLELAKGKFEENYRLFVDGGEGFLNSRTESGIKLGLEMLTKSSVKNVKAKLIIPFGPSFLIYLNATAERQSCAFSFQKYDFGACLVQTRRSKNYFVALKFSNNDIWPVLLENTFEDSEDLTVCFKNRKVEQGASASVDIYFHPQTLGPFNFKLEFNVNFEKYLVEILGEAVPIKLELLNESDLFIDLGGVLIGSTKKYVLTISNNSGAEMLAFFDLLERLPVSHAEEELDRDLKVPELPVLSSPTKRLSARKSKKKGKKGNKKDKSKSDDKTGSTTKKKKSKSKSTVLAVPTETTQIIENPETIEERRDRIINECLKILPNKLNKLGPAPGRRFDLLIEFSPKEHLGEFQRKIYYQVQDRVEPLCILKGHCIGPAFEMDKSSLSFEVVIGCSHTLFAVISNTGDISGRFKWTLNDLSKSFTITPMEGTIFTQNQMKIAVKFQPKSVQCDLKSQAKCAIEGFEKPLILDLLGSALPIPPPTRSFEFTCPVRETAVQEIALTNPASEVWILKPIYSSPHFNVVEEIVVGPLAEFVLSVEYAPKLMTPLQPHNVVLFLPLPDGKGLLYNLIGKATAPLPIKKISREIYSKENYTENLLLENWLNVQQFFKVHTELVSSITSKSLYKIMGSQDVVLSASSTRNFPWTIYVVNEMQLDFKVIFTNEATKEYMFYEINLKVLPSQPLDTIKLSTCVRVPTFTKLKLLNPINVPVIYAINCKAAYLFFDKMVSLEPYSVHNMQVEYNPLKSNVNITDTIEVKCDELGTFRYNLILNSLPPVPENTIRIQTVLGEKASSAIQAAVDFIAKFDHPVFYLEKVPDFPGKLLVYFDPSEVGTIQSKLILKSDLAGEFIYPLIGECLAPSAKGPIMIKPGSFTMLNFTNPFLETLTFNYLLDSNAFYLKTQSEELRPKSTTKLAIQMQTLKNLNLDNDAAFTITGKLIITTASKANIKWIYYLQSETSNTAV